MKWEVKKISDIGTVVGGATPSTKRSDFWDGDIPWITPKDLSDFNSRFISKGERNITKKGFDSCSAKMLPKHSVLFSSRAPIGYVAIAENDLCTNQGFKSIIPNEKIDYLYLFYLLKYQAKNIEKNVAGGSTFSEISGTTMKNIEISVPPLNVQKKISSILNVLDEKIEINNDIICNIEERAQCLYDSWFVDYGKWGGTRPDNWKDGVLSDFLSVKRGGSPRPIADYITKEGINWLKISDVTCINSPFVFAIKEKIKKEGLKKTVFLREGTLVLSNSATPGIPKIIQIDTCIHDGWLYFVDSKLSNEFLYLFFKSVRKHLVSLGNGSIFTNLKTDIVKGFPIPKIPMNVLKDFDSIIKPYFDLMLSKTIENRNLVELKDSLFNKLMSGEIDVNSIKIEE